MSCLAAIGYTVPPAEAPNATTASRCAMIEVDRTRPESSLFPRSSVCRPAWSAIFLCDSVPRPRRHRHASPRLPVSADPPRHDLVRAEGCMVCSVSLRCVVGSIVLHFQYSLPALCQAYWVVWSPCATPPSPSEDIGYLSRMLLRILRCRLRSASVSVIHCIYAPNRLTLGRHDLDNEPVYNAIRIL